MRAKSLDEGLSKVILLDTTEVAFEENNGKLVYASGPISTDKVSLILTDFFICCCKGHYYLSWLLCFKKYINMCIYIYENIIKRSSTNQEVKKA